MHRSSCDNARLSCSYKVDGQSSFLWQGCGRIRSNLELGACNGLIPLSVMEGKTLEKNIRENNSKQRLLIPQKMALATEKQNTKSKELKLQKNPFSEGGSWRRNTLYLDSQTRWKKPCVSQKLEVSRYVWITLSCQGMAGVLRFCILGEKIQVAVPEEMPTLQPPHTQKDKTLIKRYCFFFPFIQRKAASVGKKKIP